MDGVTILNAYKTLTDGSAVWMAIGVVCAIFMFLGGIFIFAESVNWKDRMFAAFVFSAAFAVCTLLYIFVKPVQYYEVLLGENVNWQEFTKHYEVEKARGQILTVREVEHD